MAEKTLDLQEQFEENERKARVEEAWKKMNCGVSVKVPKRLTHKLSSTSKHKTSKTTPDWMVSLGLAPKKASINQDIPKKSPGCAQNVIDVDCQRLAAAALAAARDSTSSTATGRGKVEVTEVRDFAGEEIEVKKLVDADSKEAAEKAKLAATAPTALDSVLEQIKKKQKLSVLDKTKKDWGEYKEENKGMDVELNAYKKSSNQYLDKVSFLQRADIREFERERDARLASQAKRRPSDMREDGSDLY